MIFGRLEMRQWRTAALILLAPTFASLPILAGSTPADEPTSFFGYGVKGEAAEHIKDNIDDFDIAKAAKSGGSLFRVDTLGPYPVAACEVASVLEVPGHRILLGPSHSPSNPETQNWCQGVQPHSNPGREGHILVVDKYARYIRYSLPLPFVDALYGGMGWSGNTAWLAVSSRGKIAEIDIEEGGGVIRTIEAPSLNIGGLTYGDNALWVHSFDSDQIYKLDPASGSVLHAFYADPGGDMILGLTWMNGKLYESFGAVRAVLKQASSSTVLASIAEIDQGTGLTREVYAFPGEMYVAGMATTLNDNSLIFQFQAEDGSDALYLGKFTLVNKLPDAYLKVMGPVPTRAALPKPGVFPVEDSGEMIAQLNSQGIPLPGLEVTFETLEGDIEFMDGTPAGKNRRTLVTNQRGEAVMPFVPHATGKVIVRVSAGDHKVRKLSFDVSSAQREEKKQKPDKP